MTRRTHLAARRMPGRRLVAYALDWADEPLVVALTLVWINPLSSGLRALIATAWIAWVGWQLWSQAETGQTFGKRIVGIEVVDGESGEPLGRGRTLARWLVHSFDTLTMVGWVAMVVTNRSVADRIVNSVVVPCAHGQRDDEGPRPYPGS